MSDSLRPLNTVHGILQARILEWVAFPFSRGIFPTQGSNPGLLNCRQILYHLSYWEAYTSAGTPSKKHQAPAIVPISAEKVF